jgi:hypothetical protein
MKMTIRCASMINVLAILVLGCSGSAPKSGTGDKSGPQPTKPEGPQAKRFTAEEFGKAWNADKDGMEEKYGSAPIEVAGTVDSFSINLSGNPFMVIPCAPDKRPSISVVTTQKEPWAVVGLGQQVVVRGKLSKETFDIPYLKEAEFVNPGLNTSVTLKAADLVAEVVKNRKAAAEKYRGKGVIVAGKVVRHDDDKKRKVYLDGGNKKLIECRMVEVDGPGLGTALEVGKEVRVFGQVTANELLELDAVAQLEQCLPITGK